MAEKKTKRTRGRSPPEQADRCEAVELLDRPPVVANRRGRWTTCPTPRIAWRIEETGPRGPEGDLDVDRCSPSFLGSRTSAAPRWRREQLRQELSADDAGCSREQDHAAHLATRRRGPAEASLLLECRVRGCPGRRDRKRPGKGTAPWLRHRGAVYRREGTTPGRGLPVRLHPSGPGSSPATTSEPLFIDRTRASTATPVSSLPCRACLRGPAPTSGRGTTQINLDY
jgi:hypothetical protein